MIKFKNTLNLTNAIFLNKTLKKNADLKTILYCSSEIKEDEISFSNNNKLYDYDTKEYIGKVPDNLTQENCDIYLLEKYFHKYDINDINYHLYIIIENSDNDIFKLTFFLRKNKRNKITKSQIEEVEKTFCKNLIIKRKQKGLSQHDVANVTGFLQQQISLIETNKQRPTLPILIKYLLGIGIDINDLFK